MARHRVRATTWSTYEKQLRAVNERLGEVPVRKLRPEQVAGVIADIADGSASRARNIRMLLVQLLDEAVNLGLAEDNVARKVRSPRVPKVQRRTLSPAEVARLVSVCDERYVAAVALCFVQGWRVSEALGLAWQDLDLDAGTVRLRRGATYADGIGMVLGAPKTSRTAGRQLLAPTTLTLLAAHHDRSQRLRGERVVPWPEVSYQGEVLDLVFVNPAGSLMLRQHVDKAIRKAAEAVGLDPSEIGTHTGRRSVVTNLYASGDLDLEDVARFVGHSDVSTTRLRTVGGGATANGVAQGVRDPRPRSRRHRTMNAARRDRWLRGRSDSAVRMRQCAVDRVERLIGSHRALALGTARLDRCVRPGAAHHSPFPHSRSGS